MRPDLLLAYDFPPMGGGIARLMGELARHYPPGHLVVSTGHPGDRGHRDEAFPNRIDRVAISARRLRTVPGLLRWSRRASTLARELGVGFTWCGNLKPAAYPARWTFERVGTPYGIIVYGMDLLILRHQIHRSALKRRAARLLLQSASVLVGVSRWTGELCRSLLDQLLISPREGLVRTVPLGTDPDRFRPGLPTDAVRHRYGLEDGRWLLTVARLTQHKGIDTVLHALADLRHHQPPLRYAIVGAGEYRPELEHLARRLRVFDRVRFLADVPDADLPALYNLADIYLGVSRQVGVQVEGFGLALVEAAASGLPVIAGRSGGIADAVRDGETGILVEAEDRAGVAAAVRRLLDDAPLAQRLGAAGRRAAERFYNWDRVVRDLRDISGECRADSPRRAGR